MFNVSTLKYRTARGLRVVPYNRVSAVLGSTVEIGSDFIDDGYGFLIQEDHDSSTGRRVSEIDKETALLLFTLQEAGELPDYLQNANEPDAQNGLLNLLYGGLIEAQLDGDFVSGTSAAAHINKYQQDVELGKVALVSHDALMRADQMGLIYEDQLFNYLYQYHMIPASPSRRTQLNDDRNFLKLSDIEPHWRYSDQMEGWHYFSDRDSISREYIAKLYVSPVVDDLPKALHATAGVLSAFRGASFKVGAGRSGILRPDKLVIYFDNIETLMEAADALAEKLDGVVAHGVPFTSRISTDGLISWGMDPRQSNGERKSWRQWIIEKLAGYMLRNDPTEIEKGRWKLALAQLELEGINSNTFRPGGSWITEYS